MRTLAVELRKEKRTGVFPLMTATGILGAACAFANFVLRGDTLLHLPFSPMDVLLTQLYGMILVLNMFGIIVAACILYHMEFKGSAVKKMYMLPMSVSAMYFCKFLILTAMFLAAVCIQNAALAVIGVRELPQETFDARILVAFAGYSFLTSMPVLSFMLFVSSRTENMWVPLGTGVAGFLSGMALSVSEDLPLLLHPFVVMLKPAVAMSAQPDVFVAAVSLAETILFLCVGIMLAKIPYPDEGAGYRKLAAFARCFGRR
ncbi:MAG: ABC transporter permease [Clostridiales bacterium]|nr:ABC transporter permease [Clostridiales bacterium]